MDSGGSPQAQTAAQGSHSVGKEKMSRDRQGQDSSETQSCYPSIAQKGERKRKLQDTSWLYLPRSQAFFILTSKIPAYFLLSAGNTMWTPRRHLTKVYWAKNFVRPLWRLPPHELGTHWTWYNHYNKWFKSKEKGTVSSSLPRYDSVVRKFLTGDSGLKKLSLPLET